MFSIVIYFLVGFQLSAAKFFVWLAVLLAFTLASESLGLVCAVVTPDSKIGITVGAAADSGCFPAVLPPSLEVATRIGHRTPYLTNCFGD
jgi:hypothetical protein